MSSVIQAPSRTSPPASIASDLYSLGVMLYQLLVGDWPRPLLPLHASFIGRPSVAPARAPSALAMSTSPELAVKRDCQDLRHLSKRLQGDQSGGF